MYLATQNRRERVLSLSSIFLFLFISQVVNSQKRDTPVYRTIANDSDVSPIKSKSDLNYNTIAIQFLGSILQPASINTLQGSYILKSKLQSSYSIGFTYQINPSRLWGFSSGLHLNATTRNFFLHIPDNDLTGFLSTMGAPQIQDNDIYFRIVLPFRIIHKFRYNVRRGWDLNAGVNLNYSGFSSDESIGVNLADTNLLFTNIFAGNFKSNNNKNPWVSFVLSASRNLYLKNNDQLRIELLAEFSNTPFLKGDYEITIPNKPVTRGTYSATGSCIGVSVGYIFTGSNRRFVKQYEAKRNL